MREVRDDRRLPDFFILGAAKAGTTTLAQWLRQHPQVYLPRIKETEFFSHDPYYARGLSYYATHYRSCRGALAVGDATPHYLLYEKVAQRLVEYPSAPDARFVVVLRDPVQRAYSWYWTAVREGIEDLPFEQALEREAERTGDSAWVAQGRSAYAYYAGGCYATQLERYLALFDRSQFLFLLTEDLVHPVEVCGRLARFLDVDPHYLPKDTRPANRAARPRSARLNRFLARDSRLKAALRPVVPAQWRPAVTLWLRQANLRNFRYPPMDEGLARRLRQRYAGEVKALMNMIDRDLSHWL